MGRTAFVLLSLLTTAGPDAAWPLDGRLDHGCPGVPLVEDRSGHHFSYLPPDNARIGWDFGRNPWNPLDPQSFCTPWGRERLHQALARATAAGETRMSFDLGFDFRSVVLAGPTLSLDSEAWCSVWAFLQELTEADRLARLAGRRFAADVVITDFRMADGVYEENGNLVGEHPDFITTRRAELMAVLAPLLSDLGNAVVDGHRLVSLNLMNEPECVAMSPATALERIQDGRWDVRLQPALAKALGLPPDAGGDETIRALKGLAPETYLACADILGHRVTLRLAALTPVDVRAFLIAMQETIASVAPEAEVHIGWIDDQSAIESTRRLESQAGRPVTNAISFHVYPGARALTTTRLQFVDALGDRPVRISEYGLGCPVDLEGAILQALRTVRDRGFQGVLFWWDSAHCFDQGAYARALATFVAPAERPIPYVAVGDAASLEGDSGVSTMRFPVRLAVPTPNSVSFRYSTIAGTAAEGSDYVGANRTLLAVPTCAASHPIDVAVNGDTTPEIRETFGLELSEPAGVIVSPPADPQGVGTILDNEGTRFVPLPPCRLADTRDPFGASGGPALAANSARSFPVAGRCGVPPEAKAAAVNLTAVGATDRGNFRLYAAATPAPLASVLNFVPGRPRANNAIVLLGHEGMVNVRSDMPPGSAGIVHVVLDVFGYFRNDTASAAARSQ